MERINNTEELTRFVKFMKFSDAAAEELDFYLKKILIRKEDLVKKFISNTTADLKRYIIDTIEYLSDMDDTGEIAKKYKDLSRESN